MQTISWIVFRTMLEKCNPDKKNLLLRYLSSEEQEKLNRITPVAQDPFTAPLSTEQRINRIHYSWLIAFLEPFTDKDRALIISTLSTTQEKKLRTHFNIHQSPLVISSHIKNYVLRTIFHWLISDQKELIPMEFLPYHSLNELLTLSKPLLQTLVDYLGLHDLAVETQLVIKTKQIHKIQRALSKSQRTYLKILLTKKEPISFARLNLKGWNGDEAMLKGILHCRGFNRLAKALFGCHPSLLWHLCHTLDIGRNKILRRFLIDINNEQIQEILTQQVLELIPIIHKEK